MAASKARAVEAEKLYTISDFEKMPEFSENYELIDGRIAEKAMPGDRHGRIARLIEKQIILLDPQDKLGMTWRDTTIKIAGDEGNGRTPDMAYVNASRVPPISDGSLAVVPDLVVEVWSPSDNESKSALESTWKKREYWREHGVKITWCINPKAKEVEVLYTDPNKADVVLELGDTLDGEDVIPGFKMPVAALFE